MARLQRLDIQALRAVAVGLVVVFHLTPRLLPGGYIGVDVFFVISGFLITTHLAREAESTGSILLGRFWARRVRRLLPAALLVLLVSAIAAFFLLPPSVLTHNLAEIFFASVYVLNWVLAADSVDYLAADTPASVAQHYWSLSVEEQFYIAWPLILIAGLWVAAKFVKPVPARKVLIAVLAAILVASLAFSIVATFQSQPSAYFVTTTRAWEFAAGGLIGFAPAAALGSRLRGLLSWAALLVLIGCAFVFDSTTPFPGWVALLPVLATAGLIWLGDSGARWSPQGLARVRIIQFVGDNSYSIYLWHWPVIIFAGAVIGHRPGGVWIVVLGLVTVVLGWLTKKFVEDPIRSAPGVFARNVPTFAAAGAGMLVVAAVSIVPATVIENQQLAYLKQIETMALDEDGCFGAYAVENDCAPGDIPVGFIDPALTAQDDHWRTWIGDEISCDVRYTGPTLSEDEVSCEFPFGDATTVLVGDSLAEQYVSVMSMIAKDQGFRLLVEGRSACSTFATANPEREAENGSYSRCVDWGNDTWQRILADDEIDRVIISTRSATYPDDLERAIAVLQSLVESGKEVVVVKMSPGMEGSWPTTTSLQTGPGCVDSGQDCSWTPPPWDNWFTEAADRVEVPVIDTWDLMCTEGECQTVVGGTIAYWDTGHFSSTFVLTMKTWFERELNQVATVTNGD